MEFVIGRPSSRTGRFHLNDELRERLPRKILGMLLFVSVLVGTACGQSLNEQLFIAVGDGNLREVQSLLSRGADASVTRGELPESFHLKNGDIEPLFTTAFSYSLEKKNQEISLLLAHTVKLAIAWKYGDGSGKGTQYSLWEAVVDDNVEVTGILLQRGASISDLNEGTPLFARVKSVAMADLLLAHGANVNAKNSDGDSVMHNVHNMNMLVVEWLVAHGAEINITDSVGRTPLHHAVLYSDDKLVEFLLKHGADVNARDNDGETPLHMLGSKDLFKYSSKSEKMQTVKLLLSSGADVNAKDKHGITSLSQVTSAGDQDLINALQAHGGTSDIGSSESFQLAMEHFKGNSGNEALRKTIIDFALKKKPMPAVPADAEAAAGRGTYIFKNAKSPDDVLNAAKEYLSAIEAAPWVANYYFNLCTVLEKTPYSQQALHACNLYLVVAPEASDAGAVRQRIAGLQYAADRDKAQMKQRTRFIGTVSLDDLYRSGGISGTVSGTDVFLKLFVDVSASPPKYQAYAGCFKSDGVKGGTHDLVSTDTWFSFCNHAFNLHLLIRPEGEGFVEMSDSNGSLRATLNELFISKQKTMAQSLLFSANGDQGDQFYIPYAQGGNDMKHAGIAMYASDCNGDMLKKDPRALPDDFIPADKFAAGNYGRFSPEFDYSTGLSKSNVCTEDFRSKTGFSFGEAE